MRSAAWPVLVVVASLLLLVVTAFNFLPSLVTYGVGAMLCGTAIWLGVAGRRRSAHLLFAGLTVATVVVKLFTAQLVFKDDATTGWIVKPKPSLAAVYVGRADEKFTYLVGPDENSFFGVTVYWPVTRHLWFVIPTIWFIALFTFRRGRRDAA